MHMFNVVHYNIMDAATRIASLEHFSLSTVVGGWVFGPSTCFLACCLRISKACFTVSWVVISVALIFVPVGSSKNSPSAPVTKNDEDEAPSDQDEDDDAFVAVKVGGSM